MTTDPVIEGLANLGTLPTRHRPPSPSRGRLHTAIDVLTGMAGGLALWAAFPPVAAWPLAILGVLLVTAGGHHAFAARGRFEPLPRRVGRAALVGFAAGLAQFVPLLAWLRVVTPLAWLVLAVAEAAYIAVLVVGLGAVRVLPLWPLPAAMLWVAEEAVRARLPLHGFTWGRLAFSQPDTPFTALAALGGAPLVTFAVALTAGLALAAGRAVRPPAPRLLAAAAALVAAAALPGIGMLLPRPSDGTPLRVAVVQGNVPQPGTHFLGRAQQVLANHVQESKRLAAQVTDGRRPAPQLVFWPENASDVDPLRTPSARAEIQDVVDSLGVPVLVGAVVDDGPNHLRNEGIVWLPRTGPAESYAKRHLVPFGEYMPWRGLVSHLTSLTSLVPKDFVSGRGDGMLKVGDTRIAEVICFEIAFDDMVRTGVAAGGQLIVVQTNNATYMGTAEPAQQLAISQFRAVEHGRAVVVASTSGISAIIMPDGRIVDRSRQLTPAILDRVVPLRGSLTLADRLGAIPEWLLASVGILAFGVATVVERRRNRRGA
ncbi:MAG: apolipoprotein N-acyltransferase [Acidothermus sp.]|nr:apolipoprotein N-acyltransferase [Acidothermus sp.]